ncbi:MULTISPECIES: RNase adapter RapZ [Clostridium]|uniref:RNase adapter RapZ n=1 Tax=Clostridium senegalense TaxID=1465809 RepID=A0A6M0H4K9_9CLOT|nr:MULTISPECIES: RNase adapter RapZ [Clostridium]NEU05635.1 RNase adapter RapZ [Clostridium senegalense]
MRFVIVTGMSGAGKTQAMRSLEDLGYFCVDNLPPTLIPKFAEACYQTEGKIDKIAVVVDIRGRKFFDDLFASLKVLKEHGYNDYEMLFLEATDEVLVKRYKESRRKHPLAPDGRILNGITIEKKKLKEVREKANYIIDTTKLSNKELNEEIITILGEQGQIETKLFVNVLSFGFKYGIPVDADLVFDVRFLPNPYYIAELKPYSGKDIPVREYVLSKDETKIFIDKLNDMLHFLLPNYKKEGKRQLIIAIGCTGGRHRSVAIANKIHEVLENSGYTVTIDHRDINEDVSRGAGKL